VDGVYPLPYEVLNSYAFVDQQPLYDEEATTSDDEFTINEEEEEEAMGADDDDDDAGIELELELVTMEEEPEAGIIG
jgi:hypothetical protein